MLTVRRLAGGSVLAAVPFAASLAQATAPPLVLIHANLIDGVRGAFAGNAAVVVRDGKIADIVTGPYTPPAGLRVIDVRGRYVLPGLIDAHTHIASLANARRALESGVTTIRSASVPAYQDVALREAVRAGAVPGPDVVASGVFVSPDLGETMLADPRLATLAGGVTTEAALRQLVRINLDHGVDVIKTRGTERAGLASTDPRKQTYSEEQLGWIVDEANKGGVPVMAHAHGDEGAYAAVKAGVRSIEHGTWLSDSTLALMKQKGTFLVPTYITVVDLTEPGGDYDEPALTLRGATHAPAARGDGAEGAPDGHPDRHRGRHAIRTRIAVAHLRRGGRLRRPRHDAARGPALCHVRRRAAVAGRRPDRALAAGYDADLIVVEANPLSDIHALADVLIVVSNGRVALDRTPFAKVP